MIYGYIRISSRKQSEERQILALKQKGIDTENIFIDKESGKNFNRTAWQELMAKLVVGDTILIKELDRMGRNSKEIKKNYELIKNKGCFLEFLENPLLSTTNKSKIEIELIQPLVLHLLGYFAEKEREKILSRQKEGYAALPMDEKGRKISKKKNKVVGRPNRIENLSKEEKKQVLLWINKELKLSTVINNLKLSRSSLYRIKNQYKKNN